ncbi:MAG: paraquat-inducible protein A, partial [Pseudomonadota bacterium]
VQFRQHGVQAAAYYGQREGGFASSLGLVIRYGGDVRLHAADAPKVECHSCGLLHDVDLKNITSRVRCRQCGAVLKKESRNWLQLSFAFTFSALVFFIISNSFPFVAVELNGVTHHLKLLSGVITIFEHDQNLLGIIVFCTIFIFPLLEIAAIGILSGSYLLKINLKGSKFILGMLSTLRPWSMLEIFLLAVVISVVKIQEYVTIIPGTAMYAFFALVLCLVAANSRFNFKLMWEHLVPENIYYESLPAKFVSCKECNALVDSRIAEKSKRCCRCHKPIHHRKPMSVQKTIALTFAAMLLYIPANTLPMLYTTNLGSTQSSTIISGAIELMNTGLWVLALIVIIASVLIPIIKIFTMCWLSYSVKTKSANLVKQKSTLFRIIEFIGRWSMVDVFVVTLLVGLIHFGLIANADAGMAVLAFASVVILTMLATESFDSRLLWDNKDE